MQTRKDWGFGLWREGRGARATHDTGFRDETSFQPLNLDYAFHRKHNTIINLLGDYIREGRTCEIHTKIQPFAAHLNLMDVLGRVQVLRSCRSPVEDGRNCWRTVWVQHR